jgi:hypothetical protein
MALGTTQSYSVGIDGFFAGGKITGASSYLLTYGAEVKNKGNSECTPQCASCRA